MNQTTQKQLRFDSRSPGAQKNLVEDLYLKKILKIHSFGIARDPSLAVKIRDMVQEHFSQHLVNERSLLELERRLMDLALQKPAKQPAQRKEPAREAPRDSQSKPLNIQQIQQVSRLANSRH